MNQDDQQFLNVFPPYNKQNSILDEKFQKDDNSQSTSFSLNYPNYNNFGNNNFNNINNNPNFQNYNHYQMPQNQNINGNTKSDMNQFGHPNNNFTEQSKHMQQNHQYFQMQQQYPNHQQSNQNLMFNQNQYLYQQYPNGQNTFQLQQQQQQQHIQQSQQNPYQQIIPNNSNKNYHKMPSNTSFSNYHATSSNNIYNNPNNCNANCHHHNNINNNINSNIPNNSNPEININQNNQIIQKNDPPLLMHLELSQFKVLKCPNQSQHKHKQCKFYHSNKDRRRPGNHYSSDLCPDLDENGTCERGDACNKSHNKVEQVYSADKYKAKFCTQYPYSIDRCEYGEYCSFAHTEQDIQIELIHNYVYDQDFYIFHYKTIWCPFNIISHDRSQCVYAHNWQDYRRKPQEINYQSVPCSDWKPGDFIKDYKDFCQNGFQCDKCHGWKELEYHPLFYKTKQCTSKEKCTKGQVCPYYHNQSEQRDMNQNIQSQLFRFAPRNRVLINTFKNQDSFIPQQNNQQKNQGQKNQQKNEVNLNNKKRGSAYLMGQQSQIQEELRKGFRNSEGRIPVEQINQMVNQFKYNQQQDADFNSQSPSNAMNQHNQQFPSQFSYYKQESFSSHSLQNIQSSPQIEKQISMMSQQNLQNQQLQYQQQQQQQQQNFDMNYIQNQMNYLSVHNNTQQSKSKSVSRNSSDQFSNYNNNNDPINSNIINQQNQPNTCRSIEEQLTNQSQNDSQIQEQQQEQEQQQQQQKGQKSKKKLNLNNPEFQYSMFTSVLEKVPENTIFNDNQEKDEIKESSKLSNSEKGNENKIEQNFNYNQSSLQQQQFSKKQQNLQKNSFENDKNLSLNFNFKNNFQQFQQTTQSQINESSQKDKNSIHSHQQNQQFIIDQLGLDL
ncbi:hypothetical protein PPERSA_11157 [Pseudocohnilembus persalinus]|uniref:C3H1-type domain-containing protein n=1 Tax=Pseudocohnilembus persalinus TaxID=266149 RepID=A0A0V0R0C6_PSEPJ|nr:hypothetical protein PPERSA_11157 [Pseudocohnilembus persalinus]|eukprot:KRX07608.1 hypothetical protein PPERSA_11157 [Pseudocohnilembus persalinus]